MILGSVTTAMIKNRITRPRQISTLKMGFRSAHAAAMIAPHGPPAAVPVATSAAAFPPSTPACATAAVVLAVASPAAAAVFSAAALPASLMALAVFCAASA